MPIKYLFRSYQHKILMFTNSESKSCDIQHRKPGLFSPPLCGISKILPEVFREQTNAKCHGRDVFTIIRTSTTRPYETLAGRLQNDIHGMHLAPELQHQVVNRMRTLESYQGVVGIVAVAPTSMSLIKNFNKVTGEEYLKPFVLHIDYIDL